MRIYYHDDLPGDQRLPHDSGKPVDDSTLKAIGVFHWHIPVTAEGACDKVHAMARERGSNNRDIVTITKEGLGDLYEATLKVFYEEHMHEDEEVRYILEGSGYFDVREHTSDSWIRMELAPGDVIVAAPGIYHRFILDEKNMIKAMRFFTARWTAHVRGEATDAHPCRVEYTQSIAVKGANSDMVSARL
ncbi:1,2-dihydroxy-3-keto-5-methylthiopentene dioxygenase [Melanogaster broomeanus]|nr:1,2-dihydroxy-3-keto-5-methylthiopentene dioxygenase [Melanogaster broomeanus]